MIRPNLQIKKQSGPNPICGSALFEKNQTLELTAGELGVCGDVLTQRLKALELGLSGNDTAAQAVQLIALQQRGLTGRQELEMAQYYHKRQLKLMRQQRELDG